jgi:hypothetical protein
MPEEQSIWSDMIHCLKLLDQVIPAEFPDELPAETQHDFWERAMKLEMQTRSLLSCKIRELLNTKEPPAMSKAECWMYRRRVEWACQAALSKVKEGVEPNVTLEELLLWGLVTTWESDGCIAMWNHMQRGGKPHSKNPDGLTPT